MDKIIEANFDVIDIANFWMHVKKIHSKSKFAIIHGQCWEWQGTLFSSGYGHFTCHQNSYRAHRVAYYLFNGTIAKDKFICHKCDNRKCVNPKHLFEGEAQDNTDDMVKKNRMGKVNGSKKHASSKYHGVTYRKENEKWRARVTLEYKNKYIGQCETEIEAAILYDDYIKKLNLSLPDNKRFPLNFP